MISDSYKSKVKALISKAKDKKKIKKYQTFSETKIGAQSSLSKEEFIYYTSKNKGANN